MVELDLIEESKEHIHKGSVRAWQMSIMAHKKLSEFKIMI